jgi:hypothetical protein
MGKWAVETKKEQSIPHVFLAMVGLVGMGILVMIFAISVNSAPSGFNNPVKYGHSPADIEGGDFFYDSSAPADPAKNGWRFPGVVSILNNAATPVAAVALNIDQMANGFFALHAKANNATVARFESTSSISSSQIAIVDNVSNEWRIGTNIGNADAGELSIFKQGSSTNALTISNTNVGVNNDNPTVALDVAGQIHASGDICSDSDGGVCLGETISIVPDPIQSGLPQGMKLKCNPGCTVSPLPPTPLTGTLSVVCDPGYIPISCGGGIESSSGNVRKFTINPQYEGVGDSSLGGSGCLVNYTVTASPILGFVKAVCVYVGS